MRGSSPILIERDPARAFFLCLIVLAQLFLPTAFERAHAKQIDGCVALGSASDDGKSPAHDHSQQCAHCRPEAVALPAPMALPQVTVALVREVAAEHSRHTVSEAALRPLPPPRGPPVAASVA